jgi:hypothetical protein
MTKTQETLVAPHSFEECMNQGGKVVGGHKVRTKR